MQDLSLSTKPTDLGASNASKEEHARMCRAYISAGTEKALLMKKIPKMNPRAKRNLYNRIIQLGQVSPPWVTYFH